MGSTSGYTRKSGIIILLYFVLTSPHSSLRFIAGEWRDSRGMKAPFYSDSQVLRERDRQGRSPQLANRFPSPPPQ